MLQINTGLSAGDNKLVGGSAPKTWGSNKPIIARLIISEVLQFSGAWSTQVLVNIYNNAGEEAFMRALRIGLRLVGVPEEAVDQAVDELGGPDSVVQILSGVSTLGTAPRTGNLFAFENDILNIPAGEYTKNAIWRSNGIDYILNPAREWIGNVDWLAGVPNLSWLGDWYLYEGLETVDPFSNAIQDPIEEFNLLDVDESPGGLFTDQKKNMVPLIAAAVGFAVGGPLGAGVGFLAGNFINKG